jgi:hypothetical protein
LRAELGLRIFLKVLGQAEPGRLHHLAAWFDGRF